MGVYIQNKIKQYSLLSPSFFNDIANNIKQFLKVENSVACSAENLKRFLKLVELADKEWFDVIAEKFSWLRMVDAMDDACSFEQVKSYFTKNHAKQINALTIT